jgi:hypothetical protein
MNTERDLLEQIAALKKENERLSGQTGYCLLCEKKARENERLKAQNEDAHKVFDEYKIPRVHLDPNIGEITYTLYGRIELFINTFHLRDIQNALKSVEKPHQSVSAIDKKEGQV